ncbi:DinB family protein [Mucilaginibacter sp. L196]|uniref:DinB family protein n=1 Tax=Mucilaginibacter sp. L196 TaxID=1641870 RepID=UPI0015765C4C|nr:DinB family protein [Mucilaginibacter sp. L196]
MDNQNKKLVAELSKLLLGGSAHADLKEALAGLPAELRGAKPDNLPYSIWQLVEHIRIAQWDMLNFCIDPNHQSPKWPDEYWPKETAPIDDDAWKDSIKQINSDSDEFISLVEKSDLYEPIPGGNGQTILLEALQMADHTSYHIAEIIIIRRLLGAWKK